MFDNPEREGQFNVLQAPELRARVIDAALHIMESIPDIAASVEQQNRLQHQVVAETQIPENVVPYPKQNQVPLTTTETTEVTDGDMVVQARWSVDRAYLNEGSDNVQEAA